MIRIGYPTQNLTIPASTDTLHHALNPGGLTLTEALDLSLPTWAARGARPKVHISSQNPEKQSGAHAYGIDAADRYALLEALDGREGRGQGVRARFTRGRGRVTSEGMHDNPGQDDIRNLLRSSRTVAVVGLSDRPYRPSHGVAGALQSFGFRVFPVNPNLRGPVLGEEPYSSVTEIPEPVDIVDVFRDSSKVMPVAKDAVAAGAHVLWMQVGVVNEEAADYAREHGLTVVMDRCLKVDYASLMGR